MRLLLPLIGVFATIFATVDTVHAEPTNFRVGAGLLKYDVHPAPDYMPDFRQSGTTIFAEFPQDNYHGSRFIIYALDEGDTSLWGYETQMMIGYGLAQPGFRIHTHVG